MIPFPNKNRYSIVYADPPWKFKTFSEKGKGKSPEKHYDCMSDEDIYNLPVQDIVDYDSILFIWVTYPLLIQGFNTIEAWGFQYKTCAFCWVKTNKRYSINQSSFFPEDNFDSFTGLGHWTRANSELCLLATKGKPKRVSKSVRQLIFQPIREHSRKPDCTRERIVKLCGDLPRIELFARQKHEGWDHWGNEV